MEQITIFGKEEIARRLQLPLERIDALIEECGLPTDDEAMFVEWGLLHFDRLWEEMKLYGPIARMEAIAPVSGVRRADGS